MMRFLLSLAAVAIALQGCEVLARLCTEQTAVEANEPPIFYLYNGARVSLAEYSGFVTSGGHTPYYSECHGMLNLGYDNVGIGMNFTGTSIALTVVRDRAGCVADLYVDGQLVRGVDNLSDDDEGPDDCNTATATIENLADGPHEVILRHPPTGKQCWFYVRRFIYTPSGAQQVPCQLPKRAIAGISVGTTLGFIFLVILLVILYKKGCFRRSTKTGSSTEFLPHTHAPSFQPPASPPVALGSTSYRSPPAYAASPASPISVTEKHDPTFATTEAAKIQSLLDQDLTDDQVAQAIRGMRMARKAEDV